MSIIPRNLLPNVPVRGVILHWTAGTYTPNAIDLRSYNFLVPSPVRMVPGTFGIGSQVPPLRAGAYAPHTRNANSYRVGVSLCGMVGSRERPFVPGGFPITNAQWEFACELIAEILAHYNLPVTPQTCTHHAEVPTTLNQPQPGKWDYLVLPFAPSVIGAARIGSQLRGQVQDIMSGHLTVVTRPTYASWIGVVRTSGSNLNARDRPNGAIIGKLPNGVRVEVIGDSGEWLNVQTPARHEVWVHNAFIVKA